ncbi:MAG: lyase family protein [Patescibacteria group bacterium]
MAKLWQHGKDRSANTVIEAYTAGDDPELDLVLMPYDIEGSVAHAEGLKKIGILSTNETKKLLAGLRAFHALWKKGKVKIRPEDEDCHTVIENFLTKRHGSLGKKIHTGRSRNDQVLTALRLYMKEKLTGAIAKTEELASVFKKKSAEYKGAPMPGYTHMQRAMPSSAGMWLGSFAAALKDDLALMHATANVIDQSPWGSVVGYGEKTLGLDRRFTARKLGFAKVQENPLYAAMSRGKFELMVLEALHGPMLTIGKFATDGMRILFPSVRVHARLLRDAAEEEL